MPIYEYECTKCKTDEKPTVTDVLTFKISEKPRAPRCKKCGAPTTKKYSTTGKHGSWGQWRALE